MVCPEMINRTEAVSVLEVMVQGGVFVENLVWVTHQILARVLALMEVEDAFMQNHVQGMPVTREDNHLPREEREARS